VIAEFLEYRSWIGWVPIFALLAIPILLWRVLPLGLALLGAFVGLLAVFVAPPLGRDAEQFGPNLALGLVVGAVVGAVWGALFRVFRPSEHPRDAPATVVGWAVGLGVIGATFGGFVPGLRGGGAPDFNVEVLRTVAIGGGIGWSLGAIIGWWFGRSAPVPETWQRWWLAIGAAGIALFGAGIVASIPAHEFGPSIDEMSRWDRQQLPVIAAMYCIDTTIAVVTLVAVAVRGTGTGSIPCGRSRVGRRRVIDRALRA
jgi:hypothetical protein